MNRALAPAARRIRRAQFRVLLRDGRDAALPSAGKGKHSETAVGACGRVQSEPDPAEVAGRRHAARAEKPRCASAWAAFAASDGPPDGPFAFATAGSRCWQASGIICPLPHLRLALANFREFHDGLLEIMSG